MSYTDDKVKTKLSSLNETQDSIVNSAQWIMFHRRYADRTANIWLNRVRESANPGKRLNLIYLANEIAQQSRARAKTDFLVALEPLIADATALTYTGASQDIQGKVRRVVEVWRQRNIFDLRIQEQVEKRLEEIDKQKGGKSLGGGSGRLGGSLFGGNTSVAGIASELESTNKALLALNKADAAAKGAVATANSEYTKWTAPDTPVPSAPVHAARLRGLVRNLTAAQNAVSAKIQAQRELLDGLEQLIESNRTKLAENEQTASEFSTKIDSMQAKVTEVEDSIMRGQETTTGLDNNGWEDDGPHRPQAEGFTPPPPDVEAFTPTPQDETTLNGDPAPLIGDGTADEQSYLSTSGADPMQEQAPTLNEPPPAFEPPPAMSQQDAAAAANDFLRTLMPQIRHASSEIPAAATEGNPGDPRLKRRKMSHKSGNDVDEDIFGAGQSGIDDEGISAMLGQ